MSEDPTPDVPANGPPVEPPSPASGATESATDLKRRIADLEADLARATRQREETRRMLFELQAEMFPDDPPPTEEELSEERKTLTEQSISEMIDELEREAGAGGS